LYPSTTIFVDKFNVTIGFETPQDGHAVLIAAGLIDYDFNYSTLDETIVHTWSRDVISQFYALDRDIQVFPESVTNNINSLEVIGTDDHGAAYLIEGSNVL